MTDAPFFEPWPDPEAEPEAHSPDVDLPWTPPVHVAGVVVPVEVELYRGDDVVMQVTHVVAYRRGLEVHLATWQRPGTRGSSSSYLPDWRTQEPRVGFLLADGTRLGNRVSAEPSPEPEPESPAPVPVPVPVLAQTSGPSGGLRSASSWWIHPFPGGDALDVVVEWEPVGVPETSARLDLSGLPDAAEREDVLWDPPPPPEEGYYGWSAYAPTIGEVYRSDLSLSFDEPDSESRSAQSGEV